MIGVHVCEGCGAVYRTLGDYWNCRESHDDQALHIMPEAEAVDRGLYIPPE